MENSKTKAAVVKQVKVKVSSKKPIAEAALPKVEDKPKKSIKEQAKDVKETLRKSKAVQKAEHTIKEKVAKAKVETTPIQEVIEAVVEQEVPIVEASEIKPTHDATVGRRLQVQHYLDLGITSPTQISKLTGCNLSYVARLKK